jgi:transglutaminase-like putative cysteine protease
MLAGVTVAAVYGFARVFTDWSFLWPLLAIAAYTHLATMTLRRRGVGVPASAALSLVGFVLLAAALWFADTLAVVLPTSRTLDAASAELGESWTAFQQLSAPVPARTGFLMACGLAVFFAAFLADWAAFRLWSPIEAIVPACTLFVFCALLGSERQRLGSAVLFGLAALLFVLTQRVAVLELRAGWLTGERERGSQRLLRAGAALAVVAVLGGVIIGPRLPGAADAALIDWRGGGGGPSSRVTISPLVDIRQRLVDQGDVLVFTVESERPAYWRLTSLDTFDGQIWRSGGRYGQADGELPAQVPPGVASARVRQRFSIVGLSALWLPAAYQPVAIDAPAKVRYQPESATLIVDTDYPSSDDLRYEVVSDISELSAEQLDRPGETIPDELARYLELPSTFSRSAQVLAREVVSAAGAVTPYQQAMALQSFFRDEGIFERDGRRFVYDLSPGPGHGDDAIDRFLESGRGYCEQFAGTYAAMARSIGLPARVAVGFTWGEQDPSDPNRYQVRGRFAHAWPEVWLGSGVGWVAFEPTPGRGAPGMEYARVPAAQDGGESGAASASTSTPATTASPTTPDATQPADRPAPDELAALDASNEDTSPTAPTPSPWRDPITYARRQPLRPALAFVVLAALYAAGVTGAVAWRRRRRWTAARDANARIRFAWQELTGELRHLGVVRHPTETTREFAVRAAAAVPEEAEGIVALATDTDAVTFSTLTLDDARVDRAERTVRQLARIVHQRVSRRRLVLSRLDPRTLLRP